MKAYHGHKTLTDGTHVPLTKDEAEAILRAVDEAKAKRAEDMPTARDALASLIRAEQRMKDLGWWKGGGLRIKLGDECAIAETGSTGMWSGRISQPGNFVSYGDYVSDRQKLWLKPLADLTDDERAWMQQCDQRETEAYAAMMDRLADAEAAAHD